MKISTLDHKPTPASAGALMVRDKSKVGFSPAAEALKLKALAHSAMVLSVNDEASQREAVTAQSQIHELLLDVDKQRKAIKAPALEFCKQVEARNKEFVAGLEAEELRLAQLTADFQQLEQARVRAAQQAESLRLTELERDKAKELAKAESHEELDEIRERYSNLAQSEPIAPIRAEGQRVREVWDITVVDIWTLARAHPMCVDIVPRLSEIKNLLDAGVKVAGVTATRQIKAGVQAGRATKLIEV